jgi:2-polyprenyl-3-methyl-5-hydroxy-6-metoxy-1,4-benzoquinol methylase
VKIETRNHLLPHNRESFKLLLEMKDQFKTLLDVGAGENSPFDKTLTELGIEVDTVDFLPSATYSGNYMDLNIDKKYDAILCYNCAEHQLDLNGFLLKLHENLKEDGILALSVPIWKDTIVDGHIVAFPNAGLLLYNLVLARWDCSNAKVATLRIPLAAPPSDRDFEPQIAVIIKGSKMIDLPEDLTAGKGDLRKLRQFFPDDVQNKIGPGIGNSAAPTSGAGSFFGGLDRINWNTSW